jgi:tetratricopeptide (TPR) repeat protein
MGRTSRLVLTGIAALLGAGVGWVIGIVGHIVPRMANYPFLVRYVPLPHHVPERAGGTAFRFAMAHDVLHERFPRHGPAYYRERNRVTRQKLAALPADDLAAFPLTDDLASGLARLGQYDEAITLMREKLAAQEARGLVGSDLYTSYANLGTFLVRAGPAHLAEGVALIRRAIEVNPAAHFGRERWHLAYVEFLAAAADDPTVLTKQDFIGNALDTDIERLLNREGNWIHTGHGRPTDAAFSRGEAAEKFPDFFRADCRPDDPEAWERLAPIRRHITKVGDDNPVKPGEGPAAPFDEPALAIVGLWQESGGNPHFSLALGETMLRVGQRYIAWSAFERAARMADGFGPDDQTRQTLRDHCRRRQREIETTLKYVSDGRRSRTEWQHVSPPPEAAAVAGLREQFEAELAFGEDYRRAYQRYEEKKIAAGVPITEEGFYDEFYAGREPIASPTGAEEWFAYVPREAVNEHAWWSGLAWTVFGAGIMAAGAALLSRFWDGEASTPTPGPS